MIVSIHQPHFFPWLGYFHKILEGDCFVYLDNVQFRKNYFQNRTQIKDLNGNAFWFTIPVQKAPLETLINKILIAPVFQPQKAVKMLQAYYGKSPYYAELSPAVNEILLAPYKGLNEMNLASIKYILKLLQINKPFYIASELDLKNEDPNGRIIEICTNLRADKYLAGKGGRNYMNLGLFETANIEIRWQEFLPSKYVYNQINGNFIPGLSMLDVLFNIGPEKTSSLLANN
jgi:hypothetical protein